MRAAGAELGLHIVRIVGVDTLSEVSTAELIQAGVTTIPAEGRHEHFLQLRPDFTDEDLTFARQLGVDYVSVGTTGGTYELFATIKARIEAAGLGLANIGNTNVHNMPAVTLNLPGRDEKIAQYKEYLRSLGRLGVDYTTYAHMGNGIWSSPRATTRGDASAQHVDLSTAHGDRVGDEFAPPLTHGRRHPEDELWDNYTESLTRKHWFAEEVGVRIGMHPPTTRRLSNSAACRVACLARTAAMYAHWRSRTARTSESVCAWGRGSRAAT